MWYRHHLGSRIHGLNVIIRSLLRVFLGCAGPGRGTNTFYSFQNWEAEVEVAIFSWRTGDSSPWHHPDTRVWICSEQIWLGSGLSAGVNLQIFKAGFFRAFREFGFVHKRTSLMYSTAKSCGVLLWGMANLNSHSADELLFLLIWVFWVVFWFQLTF